MPPNESDNLSTPVPFLGRKLKKAYDHVLFPPNSMLGGPRSSLCTSMFSNSFSEQENPHEANWRVLESAFFSIHDGKCSGLRFERLYRSAYLMVSGRQGDLLYDRVIEFHEKLLRERFLPDLLTTARALSTDAYTNRALSQPIQEPNFPNDGLHHSMSPLKQETADVQKFGTTVPLSAQGPNTRQALLLPRHSDTQLQLCHSFIDAVTKFWVQYDTAVGMIANVLMYLDRNHVPTTKRKLMYHSLVCLFRDLLLKTTIPTNATEVDPSPSTLTTTKNHRTLLHLLCIAIYQHISHERTGSVLERSSIQKAAKMLAFIPAVDEKDRQTASEKSLYTTYFEPFLLSSTFDYLEMEAITLSTKGDTMAWVRRVCSCLQEETKRIEIMLLYQTVTPMREAIYTILVRKYLQYFLELEATGLVTMLSADRRADIIELYTLTVDAVVHPVIIPSIVGKYVTDQGSTILAKRASTSSSTTDSANESKSSPTSQATLDAIHWVGDVISLQKWTDEVLAQCFRKNPYMHHVINRSFIEFIGIFTRSAEYVSLYIDDLFRRSARDSAELETGTQQKVALNLIQYLQNKDLFKCYYQRHLARRLLQAKTESRDLEKQFAKDMGMSLGNHFTSKFDCMFRDIETSDDLCNKYREEILFPEEGGHASHARGPDVSFHILTANCWPSDIMGPVLRRDKKASQTPEYGVPRGYVPGGFASDDEDEGDEEEFPEETSPPASGAALTTWFEQPVTQCILPAQVQDALQSVEDFYLKNRSGREVSWFTTLGNVDVTCRFPAIAGSSGVLATVRQYELNVSMYGITVLMLFNKYSKTSSILSGMGASNTNLETDHPQDGADDLVLSWKKIQARTKIPANDLTKTLASLSLAPRCRVLVKEPATKSIKKTDKFRFNREFVSKTIRIRMPVVSGGSGSRKKAKDATAGDDDTLGESLTVSGDGRHSRVEDDEDRRATQKKIELSRAYSIDAAIVRIMKGRKTQTHSQLISEVISQLSSLFRPEVSLVKRRIEDLIQREYLDRDEEADVPTYIYRA